MQVASASFGCESALCPSQRGIGTASMVETALYTENFLWCCNFSGKVIDGGARIEQLLELNFS